MTASMAPENWAQGVTAVEKAPLLVTTVDLGHGKAANIALLEGDDPREAAHRFCVAHGLPENIVEPLALHLLENLEAQDREITQELSQAQDVTPAYPSQEEIMESAATYPSKPAILKPNRGSSLFREAAATAEEVAAALSAFPEPSSSRKPHPDTGIPEQPSAHPLARPSSANTSLGSEYYSHGRVATTAAAAARNLQHAAAPAADRLYADHFRKQHLLEEQRRIQDLEVQLQTQQAYCTPVSRALAAHRTAAGYTSYGERLYAEGRMDALRREQESERLKAEEEEAELAEATFKPQISKLARALQQQQQHSANSSLSSTLDGCSVLSAPWERLYSHGTALKKERRAEAIRREQAEAALKECTFKPKVDKRSASMMRERRGVAAGGNLALHERLYYEGRYRQGRKDEAAAAWLPDEATFTPRINTSTVQIKDLAESSTHAVNVGERLLSRGLRYRERLEAARTAALADVDENGKPLFQPHTLRRSSQHQHAGVSRNPENAPIGEYLYGAGVEASLRAALHAEEAQKQVHADASATYVNSVSEKMMDRLRRERLRAIFMYLGQAGPSGGGGTHAATIDLFDIVRDEAFMDGIDPEVRTDVEHAAKLLYKTTRAAEACKRGEEPQAPETAAPAAIHYDDNDPGTITEPEFLSLMQEVLARTRGIARQYLLPLPTPRKKWDDPTFRPTLDPRSKALAARIRPDGLPTHEILYKTAGEIEAKREVARRAQEEAALRECSFRPALVAAPLVKEGRALKMAAQPPPAVKSFNVEEEKAKLGNEASAAGDNLRQQQRRAARGSLARYAKQGNGTSSINTGVRGGGIACIAGEALEDGIDAIERQIKEAMARLNMNGEQFVVSLKTTEDSPNGSTPPMPDLVTALVVPPIAGGQEDAREYDDERTPVSFPNAPDLVARLRASLDYSALFGSGGIAGEPGPASASEGCYESPSSSFFDGFNPVSQQQDTPAHKPLDEDDHALKCVELDIQMGLAALAGSGTATS